MAEKKKAAPFDVRGACASILIEQNRLERALDAATKRAERAEEMVKRIANGLSTIDDAKKFVGDDDPSIG